MTPIEQDNPVLDAGNVDGKRASNWWTLGLLVAASLTTVVVEWLVVICVLGAALGQDCRCS